MYAGFSASRLLHDTKAESGSAIEKIVQELEKNPPNKAFKDVRGGNGWREGTVADTAVLMNTVIVAGTGVTETSLRFRWGKSQERFFVIDVSSGYVGDKNGVDNDDITRQVGIVANAL